MAWSNNRLFCFGAFMVALRLKVCTSLVTEFRCPDPFVNGSINIITYIIDGTEISNAGCTFASNVVFDFIPKGELGTELCSHPYPPASCTANLSNTCGCVKQEGTVYTYQLSFLVEERHKGGKVKGTLCVGAPSFQPKASPSCDPISFDAPTTTDSTLTTDSSTRDPGSDPDLGLILGLSLGLGIPCLTAATLGVLYCLGKLPCCKPEKAMV